jgi:hypothetical protein
MSNLIFVLYVEQNKQDRFGRPSKELSGLFGNGITEITHLEDKEGVFVLEYGVSIAKLLEILL